MGELDFRPPDPAVFLKLHQKLEQLGLPGQRPPPDISPSALSVPAADSLRAEMADGMLRVGETLYALLCRVERSQAGAPPAAPLGYVPAAPPASTATGRQPGLHYVPTGPVAAAPAMRHKMIIEPETGMLKEEDGPADPSDRIIVADDRLMPGGDYREKPKQGIICADDEQESTGGLTRLYDL